MHSVCAWFENQNKQRYFLRQQLVGAWAQCALGDAETNM
jgi:hypothetical protein